MLLEYQKVDLNELMNISIIENSINSQIVPHDSEKILKF